MSQSFKKPTLTIEVHNNAAQVSYSWKSNNKSAGGASVVKTVKLESLVKAFQNAETKLASPILPQCCVRYEEKGSNVNVILYHEPALFTASCMGETFENCLRPGIIMKFRLRVNDKGAYKSYSISDSACYGVTDDALLLSENTQLYGLPFPNIGSGGWICWGSTSTSGEFRSLTGLKVYVDRLFKSPFNNHLFNGGLLRNFGILTPQDLFRYIQNKSVFPREILENLGRNYTLGSL